MQTDSVKAFGEENERRDSGSAIVASVDRVWGEHQSVAPTDALGLASEQWQHTGQSGDTGHARSAPVVLQLVLREAAEIRIQAAQSAERYYQEVTELAQRKAEQLWTEAQQGASALLDEARQQAAELLEQAAVESERVLHATEQRVEREQDRLCTTLLPLLQWLVERRSAVSTGPASEVARIMATLGQPVEPTAPREALPPTSMHASSRLPGEDSQAKDASAADLLDDTAVEALTTPAQLPAQETNWPATAALDGSGPEPILAPIESVEESESARNGEIGTFQIPSWLRQGQ